MTWNANGIKNKIHLLDNYLKHTQTDILLINETRLRDRDRLNINGYIVYRNDMDDERRGTAILINKSIPHAPKKIKTNNLENTAIKINNINIISVYRSPNNEPLNIQDIAKLFNSNEKIIMAGDLNSKHNSWNCDRDNTSGNRLRQYIDNHDNIILYHTDEPTHFPTNGTTPSTIDLCITKNITIDDIQTMQYLDSDHNPIQITINSPQIVKQQINRQMKIRSFKETNWIQFRQDLDNEITTTTVTADPNQIDNHVDRLTKIIQKTMNKHSQTKTIQLDGILLPPPLIQLIKQKNKARKNYQLNPTIPNRIEMNRTRAIARLHIQNHKNLLWKNKLENINTKDKSLWKFTKNLKKSPSSIPTLKTNPPADTDKQKAEAIADKLQEIHIIDHSNDTPEQRRIPNIVTEYLTQTNITQSQINKLKTNKTEIDDTIKKLPTNKAPGSDTITNIIIKNLSNKTKTYLTNIINAIITTQYFPQQWKHATIIPIAKANKDLSDPTSYRPISLLNTMAKLTETIIHNRLDKYTDKLIINEQYGFRKNRNTTKLLTKITHDIIDIFNKRYVQSFVALDIEKAFDRVWTDGLTYKLIQYEKIPTILIKLLHNYQTKRTFQIKIKKEKSEIKTIGAGVPQGSVLGPKLFLYYINDIPLTKNIKTALYADDTALMASSFHPNVANKKLHIHLQKLYEYYNKWHIKINPAKTQFITFSRKTTHQITTQRIEYNSHPIQPSQTITYLGLQLDKRLRFRDNTNKQTNKTRTIISKLFPLMKSRHTTTKNKHLIYKTIIRPIMTYGAEVWSHTSPTNKKKYQTTQNRCLRLITNKDIYTKITTLHNLTNIPYFNEYIKILTEKYYNKHIKTDRQLRHLAIKKNDKNKYPNHYITIN